jgi:hypothetical protein
MIIGNTEDYNCFHSKELQNQKKIRREEKIDKRQKCPLICSLTFKETKKIRDQWVKYSLYQLLYLHESIHTVNTQPFVYVYQVN